MSDANVRNLVASDGVSLQFRHWATSDSPRGVVVCLHGIQSHSGWYDASSQQMADAGYAVYFADRRGSGRNGFRRGHADHGLRLLNDVRQLVRLARREHPSVPLTLLGLSWGGKTATAFAQCWPDAIDQLVLLYPGLKPNIRPNFWQSLQLRFARRHDIRFKTVRIPLADPALMTDDRTHQDFILNDPLALHFVTSGFLNSGRDLDRIIATKSQPVPPTLLMLAGNDRIINNVATRQLVSKFETDSLTIREYPNAQHTLEFDSRREQICCEIIDWMSRTTALTVQQTVPCAAPPTRPPES